jgi:hypothetical protein
MNRLGDRLRKAGLPLEDALRPINRKQGLWRSGVFKLGRTRAGVSAAGVLGSHRTALVLRAAVAPAYPFAFSYFTRYLTQDTVVASACPGIPDGTP